MAACTPFASGGSGLVGGVGSPIMVLTGFGAVEGVGLGVTVTVGRVSPAMLVFETGWHPTHSTTAVNKMNDLTVLPDQDLILCGRFSSRNLAA